MNRILLVSENEEDRRGLKAILEGTSWVLVEAADPAEAIAALGKSEFPIVLCDRDFPGRWQDTIKRLSVAQPGSCIILVSNVTDQYLWNEVILHGGFDVLTRPFQRNSVLSTLDFAFTHWKSALLN